MCFKACLQCWSFIFSQEKEDSLYHLTTPWQLARLLPIGNQSILVAVLGRCQLGVGLRVALSCFIKETALSGTFYLLESSCCMNSNLLPVRPPSLVLRAQSSLASPLGWNSCSSIMLFFGAGVVTYFLWEDWWEQKFQSTGFMSDLNCMTTKKKC